MKGGKEKAEAANLSERNHFSHQALKRGSSRPTLHPAGREGKSWLTIKTKAGRLYP